MNGLTIGSLFSGYLGLDMAAETVFGARTAWTSDIDPGACKIINHRYPTLPNHGDITGIDWTTVEPVDILTGGFPCQDLSMAGKRAGMRPGTRSGLWEHMAYAIDQLRPRYVIAENVRGLLSGAAHSDVEPCPWCLGDRPDGHLRALGAVLGDLANLGYDASWYGLRAADIGAPHGRFRVFILATVRHPGHDARSSEQRQQSKGATGWLGQSSPGLATDTDGQRIDRPGRTRDRSTEPADSDRRTVGLLPTPTARDWKDGRRVNGVPENALLGRVVWNLLPTPRATDGTKGGPNQRGSSGDLMLPSAVQQFGQYADAIARWQPIIGRPAPDPTINGRLSPQFVEWLMGLPDGWVTDVPNMRRAEQLKALGNGVVPQQAAAALQHMISMQAVAA